MTDSRAPLDRPLAALAAAHGVATSYRDWRDRERPVPAETVRAVLRAMGAPVDDTAAAEQALRGRERAAWQRPLPPTLVVAAGAPRPLPVRAPVGRPVAAELRAEDGAVVSLAAGPTGTAVVDVDGVAHGETTLRLPPDLPPGYHRLEVDAGARGPCATTVVAAPARCPRWAGDTPLWGWMVQLYALRSRASWGLGDLGDLRDLAAASGDRLGAGFVVCNPLHAATPVLPQQPSPYFPSSRRFTNPLYLRVADLPEVAALDADGRERLRDLAARGARLNAGDRLDRDTVFRLKMEAFALLAALPRERARERDFAAFRRREGQGLRDFATFCALAEVHGPSWRDWPAPLRHPSGAAVERARAELAARVELHEWLQWCCDEQLRGAQDAATAAGMPVGVIHDLAVGVDPGGADAWALQDDLAAGMTVGAPPDGFNQRGQDWSLPPLLPERLAQTGYAPFRDMLRSVLRHAGGIRIDHAMGLFRLWWIPEGRPASEGTYVSYPADDLLGVLTLEAARASAVVVAEDLGTVEDRVHHALRRRGILSSAVLWFERGDDEAGHDAGPLPPEAYPREALASVTTHDLPTAAGFWTGETVRVQAELGLFGDDTTPEREAARAAREREELRALLERRGFARPGASLEELVLALHALIAETPSRLAAVSLGDVLGDVRQPNLPGTLDEYPNWRLPLTDAATGAPFLLDDLLDHPAVRRVAAVLREGRRRAATRDLGAAGSDPVGKIDPGPQR